MPGTVMACAIHDLVAKVEPVYSVNTTGSVVRL
jgi:hypothetical protein